MTCAAFLTIFGVVKVFPFTVEVLETHGTYCVFGTICWLTAAFSHWFVPETVGKTMSELQNIFAGTPPPPVDETGQSERQSEHQSDRTAN